MFIDQFITINKAEVKHHSFANAGPRGLRGGPDVTQNLLDTMGK